MQPKTRRRWKIALISVSIGCLALSMPCALLGVLGLFGIVADVSPAENRQIGLQFLVVALIPIGLGVITLIAGLLMGHSKAPPNA